MSSEERFAIPGAGGLIRSRHGGDEWILVQERDKPGAPSETGLLEIPAGKVRAFENIQRSIEVHFGGVRPSYENLAHTGYLVFGRRPARD